MIDREARNRLLQGIDNYMDEKISPEEFDDLLHKRIAPHTKDAIIKEISLYLFDFYDTAITIHPRSECPYWKFFNRCRLLLTSDADYQVERLPHRFDFVRWIGMAVLLTWILISAIIGVQADVWSVINQFVYIYFMCGFTMYALLVPSVILSEKFMTPKQEVLFAEYPFESFADLLAVRRSVPNFLSKRFPNKPPIITRSQNCLIRFLWDTKCPAWVDRIGDTFIQLCGCIILFIGIMVFWPLVALLQFYAGHEHRTRLILPGEMVIDFPA